MATRSSKEKQNVSIFIKKKKKKKLHNDPSLKLDGVEIPVVYEYKFLGIIFDKKLTVIPHLKYLKMKYNKTFQLKEKQKLKQKKEKNSSEEQKNYLQKLLQRNKHLQSPLCTILKIDNQGIG